MVSSLWKVRFIRRASMAALPALVVGILSTGCGGSSAESSGNDSSRSGDTPQAVKQGDTLTVAVTYPPPNFVPPITGGDSPPVWTSSLGYEPLIRLNNDGSYSPALATKWELVGTSTFNITLREGVKFQDGTTMDVDDVVASLKYNFKYPGFAKPWGEGVRTIEKTGPNSVSIGCRPSCPPMPFILSQQIGLGWVISKAGLADPKKLANQQFGAGPYILNESKTNKHSTYTWDANPNYWNKRAIHWKHVVMRVITDNNARIAALKSGQVDLITQVPVADGANLDSAGFKLIKSDCCFRGVLIADRNGTVAPALKDERVRQALNHAIDREGITKALGEGYAKPTQQITGLGSGVYDPALDSTYPYDPEKAKALLVEAGYGDGLTLKMETNTLNETDTWALAVIGYWQKVGIKIDLKTDTTNQAWLHSVFSKKYPLTMYGYGTLPYPLQVGSFYEPEAGGPQNSWWVEPEVTALLEKARSAQTEEAATAAFKELNTYATKHALAVPLAQYSSLFAQNDKINLPPPSPKNFNPVLTAITAAT